MRAFALATMLLASSSLCSLAQEQEKAPQAGAPVQTDQKPSPPQDEKAGRDQQKTDNREMGPDWRMRRGDGDRAGRDDREMGNGRMMHRGDGDRAGRDDREKSHGRMMRRDDDDYMGRDRDKDRGQHQERGDRYRDDADRYRGYADSYLPRRVKICVEYDNGDEYCRYRR
ncbi:hypothetical protein [Bradyrhizobium sp.]|uniref:hypothetical protein n=1 Tax=Bradyrhizobium sp. TaxID=376 RepID=UPI000B0BC74D|nr:hypothetical protein [Bradyrhizobium sp.]